MMPNLPAMRLNASLLDLGVALGLHPEDVNAETLLVRVRTLRASLYTHGLDAAIDELYKLRSIIRRPAA
jgi:hypothetical protein